MVVGVKSSTPYVIEASPEVSINGNWLANEIDGCVAILAENGFIKVRAVMTDNHSINVTAFSALKKEMIISPSIQKIMERRPIYFLTMYI